MGLYDGFGITSNIGSSAHLSIITQTPVILVIDATGMSNSAAAMVLGYKLLNEKVNIQGIIVNRVSGLTHYNLVKEIIEHYTNIRCIGYMPKNSEISLGSRHLGLIPADELSSLENQIDKLIDIVEECIELDELVEISKQAAPLVYNEKIYEEFIRTHENMYKNKKIGIAWDKAFSFYYQGNIDILHRLGAKTVEFSPLLDKKLPTDLDSIYIGGGFPEVFAQQLAENTGFKSSLLDYLENDGKCFGECGGFMYLSQGIKNLDGITQDMVGFFPMICEMTVKLQRFGYIEMNIDINKKRYNTRAHEFHHSRVIEQGDKFNYKYHIEKYRDSQMIRQWECGLEKKNTIAGYPHLYFLSNLELMTCLL